MVQTKKSPSKRGVSPQKSKRSAGSAPASQRSQNELLAQFFNDFEVGVAHLLPSGEIIYANPRFSSALGIPPQRNLVGRSLSDFVAPHSWEVLQYAVRQAGHEPVEGELNVSVTSDSAHTIRLLFSPQQIDGHSVVRIVADEVTELAEANLHLCQMEASLRALSARILQIQDVERRKMARDLHDTTGQELAILVMSLRHLSESFERPGLNLQKALVDAADLATKLNDEIRTFSYMLHPPLLDQFGLGSALKWYVDGFSTRSNIEVKLVVPEHLNRFAAEKETALFRVVQEGLTNVLRHSGSNRAKIVVSTSIDEVEVAVTDQGKGLSATQVERLAPGGAPEMGVASPAFASACISSAALWKSIRRA